jgi:hypothetical protein
MFVRCIGGCAGWWSKSVLEMENNEVAGMDAQGGRFMPDGVDIAVESGSIWAGRIIRGQVGFEDSVVAAEVGWFFHYAADGGTRASVLQS